MTKTKGDRFDLRVRISGYVYRAALDKAGSNRALQDVIAAALADYAGVAPRSREETSKGKQVAIG